MSCRTTGSPPVLPRFSPHSTPTAKISDYWSALQPRKPSKPIGQKNPTSELPLQQEIENKQTKQKKKTTLTLQSLLFPISLLFSFSDFPLLFLCLFAVFSKDYKVSAKRKPLAFLEKARVFPPKKKVFVFAEPLTSLEKRGKTHKKAREIGKRKKQGNRRKQGLEGQGRKYQP